MNMKSMENSPQTVSEIVLSIKKSLESEFQNILVVGEVSNLSYSSAGHYYFTLSDEQSSISCALFKMDAFRNPSIKKIKNGDKVLVSGPVSLYAKRGTFQILCKRVLPYGVGNLMAQYEMLKEKLTVEGVFDQQYKVALPKNIKKIAVITALRGAALQDFLNVMKRRSHWFHIVIIPSIVQGDQCAPSVIDAIARAESLGDIDVIVLTRGGGSMEDLWGFNDENLVRKAFTCDIPIISAIGHQVNYTLLDFVADFRCETPSTAAELLTQSQMELYQRLVIARKDLKSIFLNFKNITFHRIDKVNPIKVLHLIRQDIYAKSNKLNKLKFFERYDCLAIYEQQQILDEQSRAIELCMFNLVEKFTTKLNLADNSLSALNPNNVLARGYTYLQQESGKVVSSLEDFDRLKIHEELIAHFYDGNRRVKKVE